MTIDANEEMQATVECDGRVGGGVLGTVEVRARCGETTLGETAPGEITSMATVPERTTAFGRRVLRPRGGVGVIAVEVRRFEGAG